MLILAPKTLLWQWQDELMELLDLPSAVWNGRQWVDENEVADLALALLLAAVRRVPLGDRYVREGSWASKGPIPLGRDLRSHHTSAFTSCICPNSN